MAHPSPFKYVFSPPHPAARPFLAIGAAVVLIGLIFASWLAWIGVLFLIFCLYFFRDPERFPPARQNVLLAPADGHVTSVALAVPPSELGLGALPRWRVAIFLSVLDVHVNRMPADGTVTRIAYRHGKFVSANLDKASDENERNALAIRLEDGREIAVVQIAGLIARRILCDVKEGDHVQAGGRFGIIRFGSRTDLYLPAGVLPLVTEGQTMIGGETVIADISGPPVVEIDPLAESFEDEITPEITEPEITVLDPLGEMHSTAIEPSAVTPPSGLIEPEKL
ncbi:phosphatidylserine decarboxylase [Acidisoma silvae]|uniref:Phosphatidylserine decarboxylase proenzyme n=1 Tax=Acidisoma silvae TaxID=2802396 RepID=A0A964DXF5_9PROT|nr:phosphatidylserine decarboxylase [Acidisoma silvae]